MKANLYLLCFILCCPFLSFAQVCDGFDIDDDHDDEGPAVYYDLVEFEYETLLNNPNEFPALMIVPYGFLDGRPMNGPALGGGVNASFTQPGLGKLNVQLDRPLGGASDYQTKLAQRSRSKNEIRRFFLFEVGMEFFFQHKYTLEQSEFYCDSITRPKNQIGIHRNRRLVGVMGYIPVAKQINRSLRSGMLHYQMAVTSAVIPGKQLIADDGTLVYNPWHGGKGYCCGSVHTNMVASAFYLGFGTSIIENAVFDVTNHDVSSASERIRTEYYADLVFAPVIQVDPVLIGRDEWLLSYDIPVRPGAYEVSTAFPLNRWGFRMGATRIALGERNNFGTFMGFETGIRPGLRGYQDDRWIPLLYANIKMGLVLGTFGRTAK